MVKNFCLGMVLLFVLTLGVTMGAGKAALGPQFFTALPQKDFKGNVIHYDKKIYLVDIWASWCPPCRMTIPELNKLQAMYADKPFTVIGLSIDNNPEAVDSFSQVQKFSYPVAWIDKKVLSKFPPVRGIPTMFLLNQKGDILKVFVGYTPAEELKKAIDGYVEK